MAHVCPSVNTVRQEQSNFLDGRWDAHEIGWLIAGVTAAVAVAITFVNFGLHATNYYKPNEQRQVLRIILMPAVYAVVSFFSYRFFRAYTYYEISVVVYEALAVMAFLMLLLTYVGTSSEKQRAALMDKEKQKIPIPFCCIRYRPTKPYFLHALKWSVLQYSFIRPLLSIAGIICQAYNVLCAEEYKYYFAEVYIEAIDFVSISIALYGLIVFYDLSKERLKGRRPLAKFLNIKLIIAVIWWQGFVFSALASHDVIKETDYWTKTNIADGLNALCVCCEMVLFAAFMMFAYNYKEYRKMRPSGARRTSIWKPIWDCINYSDFIIEGWKGVKFGWDYARGKPGTHASDENKIPTGFDIEDAFAAEPSKSGTSIPMMETQRERPQAAPKSHDSTIHNQPTEALVPWREEHFVSEPHPYSSQQHRLQYRFPPSLHEEGGENFTSQASMFNRTRSEGHVRSDSLPSQRGFLDPRDSYYNDETLEIPWEQRRQNSSPNQDHPFVGVAQ